MRDRVIAALAPPGKSAAFSAVVAAWLLLAILLLPSTAPANLGVSDGQIAPTSYPGNFVASDGEQVCYELERLQYIGSVTIDMRGFKVDPPVNFRSPDGFVGVTVSSDGRFLAWEVSGGANMIAIFVKGGPGYNLYNYVGSALTRDGGLSAPPARGKYPQISHYNVCYEPRGAPARAARPVTGATTPTGGSAWSRLTISTRRSV